MSFAPPAADIMDALLRASDDTPYPGQQALERLIRRAAAPAPAPKPTPQAAPKPAPVVEAAAPRQPLRSVPPKTKPKAKRKATHYFEVDAAARLDAARTALADLAETSGRAPRRGRRISKSAILETALILACDAFEAAGQESPLARRLLSGAASSAPKAGA